MEYNYTKEWKQPHKVYSIGKLDLTSIFTEGIKLSVLLTGVISVIIFFLLGFLAIGRGATFLSSLFKNTYVLIITTIVLIVWTLSTLKYDNKTFIKFIISRGKYSQKKDLVIEHEDKVVYFDDVIEYSKVKHRKKKRA